MATKIPKPNPIASKLKQPKTILIISLIALTTTLLVLGGKFALTKAGVLPNAKLNYTQEYIANTGNIKGDVDLDYFLSKSSDFTIGANHNGYAVFKDPQKAFRRLKKDYKAGIELIQQEFNLPPLSNFTRLIYKQYGWQTTSGSEEEQQQALFVSKFLDIYENSFDRS